MNFLHQEFEAGPDDTVEVVLDGQANVMLLDPANFENYRNGRSFRYHGGLARYSPTRLVPPHQGRWHLAVDLGGQGGSVRAGVRVLRGMTATG
ncbi:hypothetical protein OJF2_45320 [Aquisphaera giovannonii]|uniref:DUF1883 domain-containing protein n=1 Tax=Aquisphaera giovannonii TaxID=406548 RepID=A0A5B9W6W2_9BACT|nr:DUF1883 domain-containing protein [Aquisphaera giovannonii]QEH35974.1 hypothetical protein OJF2_45320 [Aquisphaera giovannonii]